MIGLMILTALLVAAFFAPVALMWLRRIAHQARRRADAPVRALFDGRPR